MSEENKQKSVQNFPWSMALVILIAVLVSSIIFWWQNSVITEISSVQKLLVNEIKTLQKQFTEIRKSSAVPVDCQALGLQDHWQSFLDKDMGISLCYLESWGEAELINKKVDAYEGEFIHIDFPNQKFHTDPSINLTSSDFRIVGDTDAGGASYDWMNVDFALSDDQISADFLSTSIFPETDKITVQKIMINKHQALKVNEDVTDVLSHENEKFIRYYIPRALINGVEYNIHISGGIQYADVLENIVESFRF